MSNKLRPLEDLITQRRTHKAYNGNEVGLDQIQGWLETAKFAPNHRKNEPWRFLIVQKENLHSFFESFQETAKTIIADEETRNTKLTKLKKIFDTAGALMFVASLKDDRDVVEKENYAAISCLVQNLMLLAEEQGVGTFWSTNKIFCSPEFASTHLPWTPTEADTAAALFFGHPLGNPVQPEYTLTGKVEIWEPQ